MTEHEWLSQAGAIPMLKHLGLRSGDRKVRLFRIACARAVWPQLIAPASRACVEMMERCVEGGVPDWERVMRSVAAERAYLAAPAGADRAARFAFLVEAVERMYLSNGYNYESIAEECFAQFFDAALLRDIFGNPYRPVTPDPSWLTSTVVGMANAIYQSRAFHDMQILADALEESGCGDEAVLEHCRGEGPHVRGCWALDLCLGKS